MKCKQCNTKLTGKKQYCNDACRMAYGRKANKQPEQTQPEHQPEQGAVVSLAHYQEHPELYATRTNPTLINWDKPMSMAELNKAGLKGNRTAIPGDHDYVGCWQRQGTPPRARQGTNEV